jgi:drug/metabolite transporter (DMT)-like permease
MVKNLLWLLYAVLAALAWGVWGILTKFISADINPFTTHFMFTTGAFLTLPFVIKRCKLSDLNLSGILIGTIAGILVVLGNVAVYKSFNAGGNASVVIPFTNLYPLITIMIALTFFKEKLNWINILGIIIVLPAIILMSGQTRFMDDPLHSFQKAGGLWLLFAILALVLFGLYSASQKIVAGKLTIGWSYVSFLVSASLVSLIFLLSGLVDFHFEGNSFFFGSAAGFLDGLGVLAIFSAYRAGGKASKVSTIASTLQQVFTVFMAVLFLEEKISLVIFTGICMAVCGSYLLSVEKKKSPESVQ